MQKQVRELNDQPTTHRLLTTDQGKMYDLYILEPDGTRIKGVDLNDDTLYFDWKDHCITPSAFKSIAEKYNCQYTEETFKFIHREFLDNYLNSESVLDVCINDKLVQVTISNRGINLYCHSLGIDQTFYTIEALNKFLAEQGSPSYYKFEQDVSKKWASVVPKARQEGNPKRFFLRTQEDNTSTEVVTLEMTDTSQFSMNSVSLPLTDLNYLRILEGYYNNHLAITQSIAELSIYHAISISQKNLKAQERIKSREEVESLLDQTI